MKWGAVSEGQLQKALRKQQERGGILGRCLVDMGFVGDVRMKNLLERFHRRRDLSVADIRVAPEILAVLPKDVAWTWSVLPLDVDGDEIVVAVPDACMTECLTALARSTGRTVLPVTCPEAEIREALSRHYGVQEVVDAPWILGSAPLAKFLFETYVVGDANRTLYEVAMEVALAPGEKHNPLFIFGEVGHGKTHLLNAVGNRILQDDPSSFVLYLPVVRFADELLIAVERNKLDEFRMLYSRADVLLLDDVQFLADQKAVQEEFANLFEIMQAGGRQIVVTSDRPPEEVETLADRVRSGLGAGLIIAVEDRAKIAPQKRASPRIRGRVVLSLWDDIIGL